MSAPTDQTILFPERVDPATEHLHIRPMPERRSERASERRPEEEVVSEEIRIAEDALVSQVNQWIYEGNVRRIILKTEAGHTLIEIPLTAGIIGTAVGAVVFA